VFAAEAFGEAGGDGGAGEQAFAWAEGFAAGARVDDAETGVDGTGERFRFF
jgi:hypothetical protein